MTFPVIDSNWERWIYASIFKFLKTQLLALDSTYYIYIEGTERDTNEHPTYLEMRLDGPFYKPFQGFYRVEVELNIEISVQLNKNLYDQNKIAGHVSRVMDNYIPIYKLGNTSMVDDASVSIGCMRVDDSAGIIAHKYGQIATKTRLLQGTVEAKYWINLPG